MLDRPNPLGGDVVEGNLPAAGLRVVRRRLPHAGAPRPDARRAGAARGAAPALGPTASRCWRVEGWRREHALARDRAALDRAVAEHADDATALVYPGALPGRGDRALRRARHHAAVPARSARRASIPPRSRDALAPLASCPASRFVPTYFRPQFQKHAARSAAASSWWSTDAGGSAGLPHRHRAPVAPARASRRRPSRWREAPYEFVADRPAIDLLTGGDDFRRALDGDARPRRLDRQLGKRTRWNFATSAARS